MHEQTDMNANKGAQRERKGGDARRAFVQDTPALCAEQRRNPDAHLLIQKVRFSSEPVPVSLSCLCVCVYVTWLRTGLHTRTAGSALERRTVRCVTLCLDFLPAAEK